MTECDTFTGEQATDRLCTISTDDNCIAISYLPILQLWLAFKSVVVKDRDDN